VAYAVGHSATPLHLRLAGVVLILYLASPIDLIPIFVPVLGLVDDLIIVPLGLSMVVDRLPESARADAEAAATAFIARYVARPLRFLVFLVLGLVLLWTTLLWLMWWALLA